MTEHDLLKPSGIKCVVCKNDIPQGRIDAVPHTRHCVNCVGEVPPRDPNEVCDRASDSARNGWGKSD